VADEKKSLLNENAIRRFMALAGVESLVNPFLKNVNEQAAAAAPVKTEPVPFSDTTTTATAETTPAVATTTPPPPTEEVVEEAEELEEAEDTPDFDPRDIEEGVEELEEDEPKLNPLPKDMEKHKKLFPAGKIKLPKKREPLPAPPAPRSSPRKKRKSNESKNSPTSRSLAESILRHIPNLEIVDDESTFKTERQSDILQEVLRRVKRKLS